MPTPWTARVIPSALAVFQTPAFQVIVEFPRYVLRQRRALQGHQAVEIRVIAFHQLVE